MENDISFLVDFDGTISKNDIGFSILNRFSVGSWKEIDEDFLAGKIGSPEAYRLILKRIKAKEEELKKFVLKVEKLDPSFKEFHSFTKKMNFPLSVVSDGFGFYIREIFKKHCLNSSKIYANEIIPSEESFELETPFGVFWCEMCGTCKLQILRDHRENSGRIVYIGDGYSDRCAVEEADDVFSRRTLWRICAKKEIDSWFFRDFSEILKILNWQKSLIIFDLDGTLVDSEEGVKRAYEYLCKEFALDAEQFKDPKKIMGLPLKVILSEILPPSEVNDAIEVFRNYYKKIYLECTEPVPYLKESLIWFKERGYKLAILTNKSGSLARNLIEHLKLDNFFEIVLGEGDTEFAKPSSEVLNYLLRKNGVEKEEAVLIGDSLFDARTARSAEVDFMAVSTGPTHREELAELKPVRLCGSIRGIIEGFKTIHIFQKRQ